MGRLYRRVVLGYELTELETNVPDHPGLKVGNSLTLVNDPREWEIRKVADAPVSRSKLSSWNQLAPENEDAS